MRSFADKHLVARIALYRGLGGLASVGQRIFGGQGAASAHLLVQPDNGVAPGRRQKKRQCRVNKACEAGEEELGAKPARMHKVLSV
jgi:hypothetical protein